MDRIPEFQPCIGEVTVIHVLDELIACRRKVCKACHGTFTRNEEMPIFYESENAAGLRWDDADINIDWLDLPRCMAEKDRPRPGLVK